MRPTFAVINLSNLKRNYLNIRKKIKNVKLMAVVKADAYGHGVQQIVKTLLSQGKYKPEYFAAAISSEGVELRKLGVKQPILIFEPYNSNEAVDVFKYNLIPTVFTARHLRILKNGKIKYGRNISKIKVHVKIDTGMNRLGISCNEALRFINTLSNDKNFLIDGIYTHFATSDESDKKFAYLQLKRFNTLLAELKEKRINFGLAHTANSGAIVDMPESYLDMVRPGISLYGYFPSHETSESIKLKPVMSIVSHVAHIKDIEIGESVSYGRVFTAKSRTRIATIPIGYADGYNRNLTNKAKVIIKGKFYRLIGRVTMDRIMVDIKNDDIKIGETVVLLGGSGNLNITAWDWSNILNTIPYEVTCNINKRVPRIYKA